MVALRLWARTDAYMQGPKPQGIGYGIGLAFALFGMLEVASLVSPPPGTLRHSRR
jgi:hypothetical protein